ncbi:hypothetical protein HispidOSU_000592 [Sigmodon hispidus]
MAKFVRNFAEKAPALVTGEHSPEEAREGKECAVGNKGTAGVQETAGRLQPRLACSRLLRDAQAAGPEGRVKKPSFTPPRTSGDVPYHALET